ncbi:MAG: ribosome small subunit-dependent GTPase A [Carnobacterium sp.]|uniref:ribosome small subunit-dependent GTPase A n=1 Tax=Carnobacterium sp. TaxID=48221 RepID=UPI0033152A4C
MPEGQIRKALSGFYYVYYQGETYQTRGRGNFRKRELTPLVGDYVLFESGNLKEGVVQDLLPRKNELVRPPVANVDIGIVVMSAIEPNFSTNLLDRFLVTLESKGIQAIIYISKIDLLTDELLQQLKEKEREYEKMGYPIIVPEQTDNKKSLEELTSYFPNKLSVFMGQSGAGKSTLLNSIAPDLELKTAEISSSLGRGKHTTRHVELLPLYGGLVADTPGFSSIDFLELEAEELSACFPDFVEVQDDCRFRGCMHKKEPGCQVKKEVELKTIPAYRYQHYLQFLDEIESRKPRYDNKHKK